MLWTIQMELTESRRTFCAGKSGLSNLLGLLEVPILISYHRGQKLSSIQKWIKNV